MQALARWIRGQQTALILTLGLGLLALFAWHLFAPSAFTVAIPMQDSPEGNVVLAYADALKQQRKDIRLRVTTFPDYADSGRALEDGKVDLALVRPDVLYPANGLSIAVLREEALVIVAPAKKKIDSLSKLWGKQLGFVVRDDTDNAVLENVLHHYAGITAGITVVHLRRNELEGVNLGRRIDALAFIATLRSEETNRLIHAAVQGFGEDLVLVPLEGLTQLTLSNPALQELTIEAGEISLRPKLPNDETKTAGISYRLVAADTLDRIPVSKLVQYLFEMRPRIARVQPSVNLMKGPPSDVEMSAALPNHRGAVDYLNREQQTFMDRWGDWLWLALFAGGGLTSVLAWLRERFLRRRREVIDKVLDRLVCILSEARTVKTTSELQDLAAEIDGLVAHAVRQARWRTTSPNVTSALIIALEGARAALMDRRRELDARSPAIVPEENPLFGAAHNASQ
jgi:TRAP-type uncharacterized transport system substrate-binding protein